MNSMEFSWNAPMTYFFKKWYNINTTKVRWAIIFPDRTPPARCRGSSQTTDKPRKRKNSSEWKKIRRNFCLLRQLQMQIAVTYVRVSSLICIFASLPCGLFQCLSKRQLCQRFEIDGSEPSILFYCSFSWMLGYLPISVWGMNFAACMRMRKSGMEANCTQ